MIYLESWMLLNEVLVQLDWLEKEITNGSLAYGLFSLKEDVELVHVHVQFNLIILAMRQIGCCLTGKYAILRDLHRCPNKGWT